MKKKITQVISVFLVMIMFFSTLSVTAFAAPNMTLDTLMTKNRFRVNQLSGRNCKMFANDVWQQLYGHQPGPQISYNKYIDGKKCYVSYKLGNAWGQKQIGSTLSTDQGNFNSYTVTQLLKQAQSGDIIQYQHTAAGYSTHAAIIYSNDGRNIRIYHSIKTGGTYYVRLSRTYSYQDFYNSWFSNANGRPVGISLYRSVKSEAPTVQPDQYTVGTYVSSSFYGVNMRKGPSTSYAKIALVSKNSPVSITEIQNGWGKCSYRGHEGWVCLDYFTKTKSSPMAAVPKINSISSDVAVNTSMILSWNAVDNAKKYSLKVVFPDGRNEVYDTGDCCQKAICLDQKGKYSFSVASYNVEGKTNGYSNFVSCTTHNPSTVKFIDWDGSLLQSVTVPYGENAQTPEIPSRKGYTFSGWKGSNYNVTSDRSIQATYKINQYIVNFIGNENEILKTEKVEFGKNATPPKDTKAPLGYVFYGWDSNIYQNVYSENGNTIDVHAVYKWGNNDLPIICNNARANRQKDGYYVYFDLTNYDKAITRGRAVVSLKTSEDKLVDMSESAAFSIPVSGVKRDVEVFIPCDKAATAVEIVIVNSYSSGVPISKKLSAPISNELMWSNWSDSAPSDPNGNLKIETRTVYRFSEKETGVTNNTKTLEGYTWDGTRSERSSGWSNWQDSPISAFENESVKRIVDNTGKKPVYGTRWKYIYYHFYKAHGGNHTFCPTNHAGGVYHSVASYSPFTWHKKSDCGHKDMYSGYTCPSGQDTSTQYWFYNAGDSCNESYIMRYDPQYRYRDIYYTYNFYRWGPYSNWSEQPVTENSNRRVETKTQYRYYSNSASVEDNVGQLRTVKGNLDAKLAGKEITLFIYKVDAASDYTNEYIGQTKIAQDGSYSFSFKLREEPSVKTGDYTVAIGIEGNSDLIVIDTIKAPKPKYTVNFYNWEGKIINSQTVEEGENANLPENPAKTGYDFKGWDSAFTNVKCDLDIRPIFEKQKFSIVFVDWTKQNITVKEYEFGDVITPPETSTVEGYDFSGWDMLRDGSITATKNMVITAVYDKKVYNVNFYDFDGNVISTQKVAYGENAILPDIEDTADGKLFAGWTTPESYQEVEYDAEIYPEYYFSETTDIPTANFSTGEYDKTIKVTLNCKDPNAVIYYYINENNTDDTVEKEYTGPIQISETSSITFYAQSLGKNPSEKVTKYYCINTAGIYSEWMPYDELPQDVKTNTQKYILESDMGYRYKDIKRTSSIKETKTLVSNGWKTTNKQSTKYSQWQDKDIAPMPDVIDFKKESRKVLDPNVTEYQYSHYKYSDAQGKICYSPVDVPAYQCKLEQITLPNRLSISGFLEDNTTYYNYNNEVWFHQKKVSGTKTQYRYSYSEVEYYKWTAWSVKLPSSSETREKEEKNVFRYTNQNFHILEVVDPNGFSEFHFAQENKPFDTSKLFVPEGYVFEGLYLEDNCQTPWANISKIVKSEKVYAKYTPKQFTVVFQMEDGTELDTMKVNYGTAAVPPATDSVPGWVFAGWDKDFNFITEDTTITGKYIKESEYARIKLNIPKAMMYVGNSINLIPTIAPSNLSNERIEWSSDNPQIASVNDNGYVVALAPGKANITVTVLSTKETATCSVTVTADASTQILLKHNSKFGFDSEHNLRITPSFSNIVKDMQEQFENDKLMFTDKDGRILENTSKVGTGSKIQLKFEENILDETIVVLTGDFNGDAEINNKDIVMINQYVLEKRSADKAQMIAIDVNGDGKVNNRDCAILSRYLVDKETL